MKFIIIRLLHYRLSNKKNFNRSICSAMKYFSCIIKEVHSISFQPEISKQLWNGRKLFPFISYSWLMTYWDIRDDFTLSMSHETWVSIEYCNNYSYICVHCTQLIDWPDIPQPIRSSTSSHSRRANIIRSSKGAGRPLGPKCAPSRLREKVQSAESEWSRE